MVIQVTVLRKFLVLSEDSGYKEISASVLTLISAPHTVGGGG